VDIQKCDFVVLWEFFVTPGAERQFEAAYGPLGAWVALFASDPAYGGTRLVRDTREPRRYLTFDYWASQTAYDAFRQRHHAEYRVIDRECARLTESEKEIGRFEGVGS
jgi:heme-degrading monooxygenase HmoA